MYWDLRWAQSPATQYSDSRRYSWPTITSTASTPTPWKVTGSSWSHLWVPEAGEQARDQPLHPSLLHPPVLGRHGGNWLPPCIPFRLPGPLAVSTLLRDYEPNYTPPPHLPTTWQVTLSFLSGDRINDLPHSRSFCFTASQEQDRKAALF